jgi:hypothetical protein
MRAGRNVKITSSPPRCLSLRHRALAAALALGGLLASPPARAGEATDTVLLTNGGRMRGAVMVENPQKGTSIKLLDGSVKHLAPGEVRQVLYGETSPPAPPPSAPPAPAIHAAPAVVAVAVPTPGILPALDDHREARTPRDSGAGRGLIVGGVVTLCLGAVSAAVGGAMATVADSSNGDLHGPAVATLSIGGGLVVIGGVLALVGVGVRAGSSSTAMASPPKLAIAPWIGPKRAGLQFTF